MSQNFEINVLTNDLIHAMNFVGSIAEKRVVKPILGNVKLQATGNNLVLTVTSNDISLKISLGAEVKIEGETTVNILTFSEIIRKLSDESIALLFDARLEQLEVKGSNFTSQLSTLPASEFPALDNIQNETNITVNAKTLLRLIIHSEFAMSTEETRYNLNGIFLNSNKNGELNATAIDGHRLATITENVPHADQFGLILPKRTVFELIKILKDSKYTEFPVSITYDSNKISFSIDNLHILSKLIDATFPDYTSLIPTTNSSKLSIHSKLLSKVVDRVATITHDKFRAIKFIITPSVIEISAFGEAKGSAKEIITNSAEEQKFLYEGDDMIFGFNPKYLLDILKNLEEHEVELLFSSSLEPLLIKPVLYENDRHIIMPMKV